MPTTSQQKKSRLTGKNPLGCPNRAFIKHRSINKVFSRDLIYGKRWLISELEDEPIKTNLLLV